MFIVQCDTNNTANCGVTELHSSLRHLQSSDVACEQAPKVIDHRLRRKTTKGTIHYENETIKNRHNFAPVSRPRLAPAKINRGGQSGVLTSARALRLDLFRITVHRHTNSKGTGRKNKIRLAFDVERKHLCLPLSDWPFIINLSYESQGLAISPFCENGIEFFFPLV